MKAPRHKQVLERLASFQHRRPWVVLVLALLVTGVSLPGVMRLEINSDFQAMLPEHAPSVQDWDEIRSRFGGTATLTLGISTDCSALAEGQDRALCQLDRVYEFVPQLVARLEQRSDLHVSAVDWTVREFEQFVRPRRHLYLPLDDLQRVHGQVEARLEYERSSANPFYVNLDEPPPTFDQIVGDVRDQVRNAESRLDRYPGGFYKHPTRELVLVFIRTVIRGGEVSATERLIRAVESISRTVLGVTPTAERGHARHFAVPGLRIDYGGDLMDVMEETDALKEAVERSTIITLLLVIGSIYLFFFSWRAIPLLVFAVAPPCLAAFAIAETFVDYLTASSAFLGSIVIGNGMNPSIMWLGRYYEERRKGLAPDDAIKATHLGTLEGTVAAALAAAAAYGSLVVTDYRGFRDFGVIGGIGMCLCWFSTFLLLPALVAVTERLRPLRFSKLATRLNGVYGVLFAKVALSRPRVTLIVSGLLTVLAIIAVSLAVLKDPLEYDFRQLQSRRAPDSRVQWVNDRVGETVEETRSGSALVLLAATTADVPELVSSLARVAESRPGILGAVRTVNDLLPGTLEEQREKVELLNDLRRLFSEIEPFLSPEQLVEVREQLPPQGLSPVALGDLPQSVIRPFVERDGTVGRLVFVEHDPGHDNWDGRYWLEWAGAVRAARPTSDRAPAVAGAAVVFADLLTAIYQDGPLAVSVSFAITVLLVLTTFRLMRHRLLTLVSLIAGVLWMAGLGALFGVKLNFLNIIAFPVTFGLGVEYGVNVMKRYIEERVHNEPLDAIRLAVEGAGGAVVLCSLTTVFGYISLYASANQALNSFGAAMSLAEVTCLVAGVISVPAGIAYIHQRRRSQTNSAQTVEFVAEVGLQPGSVTPSESDANGTKVQEDAHP